MATHSDSANHKSENEGEPLTKYNPAYKGPIKNRSCTDIICCLVFFVFIIGLCCVGIFAYVYGDPNLLIYPMDSNGNLCGYGTHKNRTKLQFFDLVKCGLIGPGVFVQGCPTPQVCVDECPSTNFVYLQEITDGITGDGRKDGLICQDGVDTSIKTLTELVVDEDCAAYYLKSSSILDRCVPIDSFLSGNQELIDISQQHAVDNNNDNITSNDLGIAIRVYKSFIKATEYSEKAVNDILRTWHLILVWMTICMLISFTWIFLLRYLAGVMVWLAVLLFVALFAGLTALCFWQYSIVKGSGEVYRVYFVWIMTFSKEKFFLTTGIILGIVFSIIFLMLLFLCERIRIAIEVIKEASRLAILFFILCLALGMLLCVVVSFLCCPVAVASILTTLLWPVVPFCLQLGVVAAWLFISLHLMSIGRGQQLANQNMTMDDSFKEMAKGFFEEIPCDTNGTDVLGDICGVIKYGETKYVFFLQIFNLFMLFWLVNFVIGLGQVTLAGAFASYYWAFDKSRDVPPFPLASSFYRTVRYHMGSIAFGSLLIAIIQLIRTFLEYIDSKLKASANPAAVFFMKCLMCCFWCLEKVLKFITKNAYIMMAVFGKNFFVSAKNVFSLILRNAVRVVVIDKVTDFVLLLSRLVIMAGCGVGSYLFFNGQIEQLKPYTPSLNFYIVPVVVVVFGAYIVTNVFFSVYSMAVDTLFICFLQDLEINDGSTDKPYFMSKGLMKILSKKNVAG